MASVQWSLLPSRTMTSKRNQDTNTGLITLGMSLLLLMVFTSTSAQFFAKTSKNLPRIGRRGGDDQELTHVIPPAVKTLLGFIRKYDDDGSGCLSPEELLSIPIFKTAMEYEDFSPFEIASDVVEEYRTEVEEELKDIIGRVLSSN